MTLFEECVQALGDDVEVLTASETKLMFERLVEYFPVTAWGQSGSYKINACQQNSLAKGHFIKH